MTAGEAAVRPGQVRAGQGRSGPVITQLVLRRGDMSQVRSGQVMAHVVHTCEKE